MMRGLVSLYTVIQFAVFFQMQAYVSLLIYLVLGNCKETLTVIDAMLYNACAVREYYVFILLN